MPDFSSAHSAGRCCYPGSYTVSGTHTYATLGPYRTTVTIIDPDPINSRMVNGLAIVTPPRS